MADHYTINIVNQSGDSQAQDFWCFLERPEELAAEEGVYANSSACISVKPGYEGKSRFVIPVQYVLEAGASNEAVGLDVEIDAEISRNVGLKETWLAEYNPPYEGPNLILQPPPLDAKTGDDKITIVSNIFNKPEYESQDWYPFLSFGIKTAKGFTGMTWSPGPNKKRSLKPKLQFYIAAGDYGSNKLADWTDFSASAALVSVPGSFDKIHNECTVYYTPSGTWNILKGKPAPAALPTSLSPVVSLARISS